MTANVLAKTLARNHRIEANADLQTWQDWQRRPNRARVWFIKGGPGQGKSTITQYICQIQRAALILNDSSTKIATKFKPAINEVKAISEKSGLWPKSPRIPVLFELKEYAKWIARENQSSSSLLSYLSGRIEEASGQKALAGTIKRAFSASRWLFVFDGMDEVPGDVKDRIAKEINHFVDDLLVDCDADAQIVCTSRPQGYSGQFDDLSAADIKLTNLNPTQALECATPILEIDRSSSESNRLCSILSEALGSPAIREIMTTPLQAHIMAVVVRDGGRPPEKKWELFSNFYKVINKREADKSADKKLTLLLRGNGKLIKALHNRLGFELHSKAEASEGAQASIDRKNLVRIIEETVKIYQREDIESTVRNLVEATTDRLVLVNTPENSQSVRFDIRPLQEFFAAEYIYESASHSTLSDRVRVIASDSHWREVLHFLLSALIENERRSELAQVIQVLAEVDDPVSKETRPFARRLAIGAQTVARLLQEGVLEEDQRTRQAFKACILPLFATTDCWQSVLAVNRAHSRRWVLEIISEIMLDQVEAENIGAAAAACYLIDVDTKQARELRVAFLSSSMPYRACIFSMLNSQKRPFSGRRERELTNWGADVILRTLLDPKWTELGRIGVRDAYQLLEGEAGYDAIRALKLSHEATSVIKAMLDTRLNAFDHENRRELKYNSLNVALDRAPKELNAKEWSEETFQELYTTGSFVRVGALLAKAAAMPDVGSAWLNENHPTDLKYIYLLPRRMLTYVSPEAQIDLLHSNGDISLSQKFIEHENKGRLRSISFMYNTDFKQRFFEVIQKVPDIAIDIIKNFDLSINTESEPYLLSDQKSALALLELLRTSRQSTLRCCSIWGRLIQFMPSYEVELRKIFLEFATEGMTYYSQFRGDLTPFAIHLPDEAQLLPYVVIMIIQAASGPHNDRRHAPDPQNFHMSQVSRVLSRAREFCSDSTSLHDIANNMQHSFAVRAAAKVLNAFSVENHSLISIQDIRALAALYGEETRTWFLLAFSLILNDAIEGDRQDARIELSALLQISRENYPSRQELHPIIDKWREITRTPVLKSSQQIWT